MTRIAGAAILLAAGLLLTGLLEIGAAAAAQEPAPAPELYTLCAFYPQGQPCAALYQQVMGDKVSPAATSVRQAVEGYGRYLSSGAAGAASGLSRQDRDYLIDNNVRIPDDLNAANQAGLHNVINDPALQADAGARERAVNNFIGRARQAELYCHFNTCPGAEASRPEGT
jgi:hypothetical protein